MPEPTYAELAAQIAKLEEAIASTRKVHRATAKAAPRAPRGTSKAAKAALRAQKRKWKEEAWKRAHLGSSLNRYHV